MTHGYGNGEMGKAVKEIGGAIEGIDDPFILVTLVLATFFRQNSVLGVGFADSANDFLFGLLVHFSHEIIV